MLLQFFVSPRGGLSGLPGVPKIRLDFTEFFFFRLARLLPALGAVLGVANALPPGGRSLLSLALDGVQFLLDLARVRGFIARRVKSLFDGLDVRSLGVGSLLPLFRALLSLAQVPRLLVRLLPRVLPLLAQRVPHALELNLVAGGLHHRLLQQLGDAPELRPRIRRHLVRLELSLGEVVAE